MSILGGLNDEAPHQAPTARALALAVDREVLSGEDGYALIRRLRIGGGAATTVPAIAVTAYGRIKDRVRVLEAGFQIVVKPVEPTELIAVIASLARRATR